MSDCCHEVQECDHQRARLVRTVRKLDANDIVNFKAIYAPGKENLWPGRDAVAADLMCLLETIATPELQDAIDAWRGLTEAERYSALKRYDDVLGSEEMPWAEVAVRLLMAAAK